MRFGPISHQRANNWDKAAEIPLVSIVTSAVRLPANILLLCVGIINLRKDDKELAKSQIRASFVGLSKAAFGLLPLISNIFTVCIINKNKNMSKTLSLMDLKKEIEYFDNKDLKIMSKPEVMWYHALQKEIGRRIGKEIEKQEEIEEQEDFGYYDESFEEVSSPLEDEINSLVNNIRDVKGIIDKENEKGVPNNEEYCTNDQKQQFYHLFDKIVEFQKFANTEDLRASFLSESGQLKFLMVFKEALNVNGSFQTMLRELNESPIAGSSTLPELGEAILKFLERIVRSSDSDKANLLANALDKFSETIENSALCKTGLRNEFQIMRLALNKFAETDDLKTSFKIEEGIAGFKSKTVLDTFRAALTPAGEQFEGFQHTINKLENDSEADERGLAMIGKDVLIFLEQLKLQKKI